MGTVFGVVGGGADVGLGVAGAGERGGAPNGRPVVLDGVPNFAPVLVLPRPFSDTYLPYGQSFWSGGVNGSSGWPASAADMNFCQTVAGQVPPKIGPNFPTRRIGIRALGSPIHTAVTSCGVYPTNQASLSLSVVPVLPAAT